jgi:hypothetical protein
MFGARDTVMWGEAGKPYLLSGYFQHRGEPSVTRPSHLDLGVPSVFVNLFTPSGIGALFGDATQEFVGPGITPLVDVYRGCHQFGWNHAGKDPDHRCFNVPAPSQLAYPQTSISAMVGVAITSDIPTIAGSIDSYTDEVNRAGRSDRSSSSTSSHRSLGPLLGRDGRACPFGQKVHSSALQLKGS